MGNSGPDTATPSVVTRLLRALGWSLGLLVLHGALSWLFWATIAADHNLTRADATVMASNASPSDAIVALASMIGPASKSMMSDIR